MLLHSRSTSLSATFTAFPMTVALSGLFAALLPFFVAPAAVTPLFLAFLVTTFFRCLFSYPRPFASVPLATTVSATSSHVTVGVRVTARGSTLHESGVKRRKVRTPLDLSDSFGSRLRGSMKHLFRTTCRCFNFLFIIIAVLANGGSDGVRRSPVVCL